MKTQDNEIKQIWPMIKSSVSAWIDDSAPSMGAALSYYTTFSLAPILIIVIAIAGIVFGREAAQGEIVAQLRGMIGQDGAAAVEGLLKSASTPAYSIVGTIGGLITLLLGATGVFVELQSALDRIWRVPKAEKPIGTWGTIKGIIRTRILSFGLLLGLGFLLLVSLAVSAGLAALGKFWGGFFGEWEMTLQLINFAVSFLVITGMFAMIYKLMPSIQVAWRDVWIGAVVTALLFVVGKLLIGWYLGKASIASGFGAAGSLVILLVWVYYSAQIFLLGAEFTWVYAHRCGSKRDGAVATMSSDK